MNLASTRLGRLLHPIEARVKVMAALDLSGYFDEGGTHAQSRVIVLAGYVKPALDWEPIEKEWKKILAEEWRAVLGKAGDQCERFYHTTDIEADPPRGIYEDWTRAQADRLTDRLVPIAATIANDAFGIWMSRDDWFAAADFFKHTLQGKPHRLPYELLTKACMDVVIDERTKDLPPEESVAFVFEKNDYAHAVLSGYQVVRQLHPQAHRLGTLAFEPSKSRWAALQAADLLAWHYRRANELRWGYKQGQPHRHITAIIPKASNMVLRRMGQKMLREILIEAVKLLPIIEAEERENKKSKRGSTR